MLHDQKTASDHDGESQKATLEDSLYRVVIHRNRLQRSEQHDSQRAVRFSASKQTEADTVFQCRQTTVFLEMEEMTQLIPTWTGIVAMVLRRTEEHLPKDIQESLDEMLFEMAEFIDDSYAEARKQRDIEKANQELASH